MEGRSEFDRERTEGKKARRYLGQNGWLQEVSPARTACEFSSSDLLLGLEKGPPH